MTYTLMITLNLILSLIVILGIAGCVHLAYRLPAEPDVDADWRDWGEPLPVALAAEADVPSNQPQPASQLAAA